MAGDEIRLWAMDGAGGAAPLDPAARTDTERLLEDTLVRNPDMLLPGLLVVGRQNRTAGGPLDLLGVDPDGRLTLFELKRGTLNRDAVAQIIDYGSWLESMDDGQLSQHIADNSGSGGTNSISDFAEWYSENRNGQELSELRPVRLFLVGLGVDDTTTRMVRFLADRGVDISLLTFHGFIHAGQTLLARQMPVAAADEPERVKKGGRRQPGMAERRKRLAQYLQEIADDRPEARELWDSTLEMFREIFPGIQEIPSGGISDWAKGRLHLRTQMGIHIGALKLGLPPSDSNLVSVAFYRNTVNRCSQEFAQLRRDLPHWTNPANRRDVEATDVEVGFPINSLAEWESSKEKLAAVTRSVYEALQQSEDEE